MLCLVIIVGVISVIVLWLDLSRFMHTCIHPCIHSFACLFCYVLIHLQSFRNMSCCFTHFLVCHCIYWPLSPSNFCVSVLEWDFLKIGEISMNFYFVNDWSCNWFSWLALRFVGLRFGELDAGCIGCLYTNGYYTASVILVLCCPKLCSVLLM